MEYTLHGEVTRQKMIALELDLIQNAFVDTCSNLTLNNLEKANKKQIAKSANAKSINLFPEDQRKLVNGGYPEEKDLTSIPGGHHAHVNILTRSTSQTDLTNAASAAASTSCQTLPA